MEFTQTIAGLSMTDVSAWTRPSDSVGLGAAQITATGSIHCDPVLGIRVLRLGAANREPGAASPDRSIRGRQQTPCKAALESLRCTHRGHQQGSGPANRTDFASWAP
jgi:hypothetical protein